MRYFLAFFMISMWLSAPVNAQDEAIQEGTIVQLDVTERTEVTQNLLVANLNFSVEADDAQSVQNQINKAMTQALRVARNQRDLDVSTGHYRVSPRYEHVTRGGRSERTLSGWAGSQSLMLESEKADAVLSVAKELQEMGFAMNGLNYQVTPALFESTQNSLLEAAVKKLRNQAERMARALGKSTVEFKKIQVGQASRQPIRHSMMLRAEGMAASKMAAPVSDAGESDVTLTVSAEILIK